MLSVEELTRKYEDVDKLEELRQTILSRRAELTEFLVNVELAIEARKELNGKILESIRKGKK